jgi:hypothetical protein
VLKAWGLPRSTFYHQRRQQASPRLPVKRGPKTRYTNEELVGEIRRTIAESPFTGEGHRKVWARLRMADVRTSKQRVLRLMREHQLLAPQRQPQPVEPKRHEGTILAERDLPRFSLPGVIWTALLHITSASHPAGAARR